MARRTFVYRDGKIIETTNVKKRHNLRTASKEEMDRRDGAFMLDDLRQQHEIDSNYDRRQYEKKLRESQQR